MYNYYKYDYNYFNCTFCEICKHSYYKYLINITYNYMIKTDSRQKLWKINLILIRWFSEHCVASCSFSMIFTYHHDSGGSHASEHQCDATAVSVIHGHFCFFCHNLQSLAPLVVFLVHLVVLRFHYLRCEPSSASY